MRAATLRRLLVFGVCAAGVSCLYLVPGTGRAPHQVDGPRPSGDPDPSLSARATAAAPDPAGTRSPGPTTAAEPPETAQASRGRVQTAATHRSTPRRTPQPGATPFDPAGPRDAVAPAPVSEVTSTAVTPDRLTLRWPATNDNVGVVSYHVLLNGYEVATTPATHATVRWFNDDARDHIVQVRAVDAAGNESSASPGLLVARPTPEPSPSPTPSTTPDPSVSPSPDPVPSPSATGPSGEIPQTSTPDKGEESAMPASPQPVPFREAH